MTADFPEAFEFLFEKARYKIAYGGRGGAKSWAFARALLIQAAQKQTRVLCAREVQHSLADSVHKLLGEQINSLGLSDFYSVQKAVITGANGSEFIFSGLKNAASLKSYEGVDICWVEEAANVSEASWSLLLPTIRRDNSEIWISFNPILSTDSTFRRFVLNPPPGAIVRRVNWQENPWFPDVLRIEAEHCRETNPQAYAHIWQGECKSALEGAVYAEELAQAEREGRIADVPYDRTRPVDVFFDLGFGDKTAIWFAQALSGGTYHLIDYLENDGKTIEWYLIQLQQRGYLYGTYWIPWDGLKRGKLGSGKSPEELMRAANLNVRMVTMLSVADGINAARTVFPQCRFDRTKCADGLQALRHYQWGPPSAAGVSRREPLHNAASHGSDSFRYFATGIKTPELPRPAEDYAYTSSWMA